MIALNTVRTFARTMLAYDRLVRGWRRSPMLARRLAASALLSPAA
jgi:hypothetical protein